MNKLIALYKAFGGGEWFRASLESVREHTDGAVVMLSRRPWLAGLDVAGDCEAPLAAFADAHPDYALEVVPGDWTDQTRQYRDGLDAIRRLYGPDAGVLIVDTDEVWDDASLAALRTAMETGTADYYRVGIYTYLRSPLFQVWPHEPGHPAVGLHTARDREVRGRFMLRRADTCADVPRAAVHHLCYVRRDEQALRAKLLNTASQEHVSSDYTWFDRVYAELPRGRRLHMSVGYEDVWDRIKVALPEALPRAVREAPACQELIAREDAAWRDRLRRDHPDDTVYPVPTGCDVEMYTPELEALAGDAMPALIQRLKTTVLEALHLARYARAVPAGGRILEIGSGSGGSMACLALGSRADVELVSVDPFEPYDETTHGGTVRGVTEGNEQEFWGTADAFGYAARVDQLRQRSDQAAACVPDASCAAILVDGNHTYEIALNDLRLYWPKLKPGGVVLIHDYTPHFPGVIRAVDEWEAAVGVPVTVDQGTSLAVVRKI